jgi:hypothetical protein
MKLRTVLLLLCISSNSYAQDIGKSSPYSFGGACASQGAWTQTALSATQSLRKVAIQLRDDENCKGLGASVQKSIQELESAVQSASDTPKRATRLAELPKEISALKTLMMSTPDSESEISKLIMQLSIEQATLSAQVQVTGEARSLFDFGNKIQQSAKSGLSELNQVVSAIPRLSECLMDGDHQAIGSFLAATVKIASALASSNQDLTGSQLATTVSNLTDLVREKKYSKVLRKLNQQEFLASMACLMEVTSDSYCQARNGMQLFQKGLSDLKVSRNQSPSATASDPIAGYYILNTHVPNITRWLQKIQIGVDPKLPTDAAFQNKIQQEVTEFNKSVKDLLGAYNSIVSTIQSTKDIETQRNTVLELLVNLTAAMTSTNRDYGNFFTRSRNPTKIPFDLIGMTVPDQVSGKAIPQMGYEQWFRTYMDSLPAFKDPLALAETIGNNMKDIIRSANIASIEYFNRWYIVDKAALINDSTIDINFTVVDSLKAVNQYLESTKHRIDVYKGNTSIIPTIVDLQIRINRVLTGYEELYELGKKTLNNKASLKQSAEQVQATADVYEKLVNIVYDQFNVMQSRSGFIANRMVNFVYEDYKLLQKNNVDFTQYQKDVISAAGMAGLEKMLQMYNGNPANIQTDLNMALRINKNNIEALGTLLKDSIIGVINELDIIQNDGKVSFWDTVKRIAKDQAAERKEGKKSLLDPRKLPLYWFTHSDRYVFNGKTLKDSLQSEFNDAENVKAQLCIQALAFNNQVPIKSLCQGAVLKSPLMSSLNVSYDQKLEVHLNDANQTPQMRKSLNHSERICAFRDYNLRNMAKYMSIGNSR